MTDKLTQPGEPLTNWRAMQVTSSMDPRTKKLTFLAPGGVLPRCLAMASWTPRYMRRAEGGGKKTGGRGKRKLHQLPTTVPTDNKGWVTK